MMFQHWYSRHLWKYVFLEPETRWCGVGDFAGYTCAELLADHSCDTPYITYVEDDMCPENESLNTLTMRPSCPEICEGEEIHYMLWFTSKI